MRKLGVHQASPAKQQLYTTATKEPNAQVAPGHAGAGAVAGGDSAQFGPGANAVVDVNASQQSPLQPKQPDPSEFRPFGFSNTLAQQDILQASKAGGLRADTTDIDGGQSDKQMARPAQA